MSWTPISGTAVQYMADSVAANDHYIKFYASGTTTPISMATDSTGGTTLAKAQFNSQGYAINGSGDEFVPHIDQKYKIVFYPNATDADNNTFANAVYNIDSLDALATVTGAAFSKNFATLAAAVADTGLVDGDALNIAERTTGNGGGAMWDVVLSSTVTENTYNIVQCTGVATLSVVLREKNMTFAAWGAPTDGTDAEPAVEHRLQWMLDNSLEEVGMEGKTYTLNAPVAATGAGKIKITGSGTFKAGASFADGQTNENLHIMTFSGDAPQTLTTSTLFYNYLTMATTIPSTKKGDRIVIIDNTSGNYWDTSGNNYREHTLAHVDYTDTTNDVINFRPEIDFPVLYDNATTREITDTNIIVNLYNADIEVHIQRGITFEGGVNPLAVEIGMNYGKGIKISRGKFYIDCNFTGWHDCVRLEEGELWANGVRMEGAYSTAGGNGFKIINASYAQLVNCKSLNGRHALAVGGSTQDGAEVIASNCVFGDTRQSQNSTTYPSDESRAVDTHGNCKRLILDNCRLYGGLQYGGRLIKASNCYIRGQAVTPIEPRSDDIKDGTQAYFDNCDIALSARLATAADALGGGIGTFTTDVYWMKHGADSGFTGGILELTECKFLTEDNTTWNSGTILHLEPGQVGLSRFVLDNCDFGFGGTNVREIAIDPFCDDGNVFIKTNRMSGCAMTVGVRGTSSISQAWRNAFIEHNYVLNTDETSGQFYSYGMQVNGDTTVSSQNQELHINDNVVHSFGDTGGISMDDCVNELVVAKSNTVKYTGAGALGHALRTNVNQNATSDHVTAHVDLNTVIHDEASTTNTITVGIQINGLAGVSGFYATGNNAVKGAVTDISTTGSAITKV